MKRCPKCEKIYLDDANFCPVDAGRLVEVEEAESPAASAPGTPAAAAADQLVGGRFELGPAIGGTVTGPVHRAVDTQDGRAVAIKLVDPKVLAIPAVAQRIERELKQLERVTHKSVAHVVASGRHDERVFIATELCAGARPLAELIAASGPVDAQRASELILAIGEGLIEAAKVGVVHRDLSPKNILVTQDTLKLINFCVPQPGAKAAGVPEYLAPEAIEGKPVDQRGNIYSLAALYYFLLTGRPPYVGDEAAVIQAHLSGTIEPPSKYAAVPADIDSAVGKALERNAARRYLTLRQFLDEIARIAGGPEGGTGATAPFGKAGKPRELAQTLMGFGGLSATLGGGASAPQNEVRTRQMDVAIPPEAMRDAAALEQAVSRASVAHDATLQQTTSPLPAPAAVVAAPAVAQAASPWAAPAQAMQQAAPAVGAAAVATPAAAVTPSPAAQSAAQPARSAAQPAAPSVAAPKVGGGSSGKKKADDKEKKEKKGKFRETMWFKKGELDAAAAEDAAAQNDANATDKADTLPIDERYTDDGSITGGDAEKYSLRTGNTSMMTAMRDDVAPSASVSERELVGEMKGGRNLMLIGIAVAVAAIVAIVVFVVM